MASLLISLDTKRAEKVPQGKFFPVPFPQPQQQQTFSGYISNGATWIARVTFSNVLSQGSRTGKSDAYSADSSEHDSDPISNNSFDGSHKRHFKSTGPPRTNCNERFRGAYSEMCQEGDDGGNNDSGVTRQEKKTEQSES